MAAALKTATVSAAPISGGSAKSAEGYVEAVYTVTTATTLDWVVLSDFSEVKYVHAYTSANGVDAEAYVDGTTKNKVFITGVGACVLLVKGTKATA
ncbi:MAG: hypothetical protein EOL95_09700 [Bacteroidia bacterium]|nr:hypothetical protein [Bacteroidia bacterium]